MLHAPEIADSARLDVACIGFAIEPAEMRHVFRPALTELHQALADQQIAAAGPWLTHHWRRPNPNFKFDICLPVEKPIAPAGRVQPGVIAAQRVVCADYFGDYAGLPAAWGELIGWVQQNRHDVREDFWEIYAVGPDASPDPAQWRTQLVLPLA